MLCFFRLFFVAKCQKMVIQSTYALQVTAPLLARRLIAAILAFMACFRGLGSFDKINEKSVHLIKISEKSVHLVEQTRGRCV